MEGLTLATDKREITGKKVAILRRDGITPIHLYGNGIESQSLQCDTATVSKVVLQAGTNIPVTVTVPGNSEENVCFVREVQYHPVTDRLIHVDFMKVDVTRTVRAEVPIIISGLSPAVRNLGGTLLQPLQSVTVEALPMNIPPMFSLNSDLLIDFDTNFYVSDLEAPDNISIINDEEDLVAGVVAPRIEREVSLDGDAESDEDAESDDEGTGDDPSGGDSSEDGEGNS
tara:strand:+ start:1496 stop:2179 length:684 start_codon:yes stop_codon:yes gene_type:complete